MKFVASLCLFAGLLSACSKKEAEPKPTPPKIEASLNLSFDFYATPGRPAETQSASFMATRPGGPLSPDRLVLRFENAVAGVGPSDRVEFTLPTSRQKPGLLGTYNLASQANMGMGDVQVIYQRFAPGSSSAMPNTFGSGRNALEGAFVVTKYDAGRRLISGTYTLTARNVRDPYVFLGMGSPTDSRRSGDLHLSGTFEEIVMQ